MTINNDEQQTQYDDKQRLALKMILTQFLSRKRGTGSRITIKKPDEGQARRDPNGVDHKTAGIGAVFGVDATGAVFFNTAVPGSSCATAVAEDKLQK